MRYGPDDKFWVVIDPKPHSTLDDHAHSAVFVMIDCRVFGTAEKSTHWEKASD